MQRIALGPKLARTRQAAIAEQDGTDRHSGDGVRASAPAEAAPIASTRTFVPCIADPALTRRP